VAISISWISFLRRSKTFSKTNKQKRKYAHVLIQMRSLWSFTRHIDV
jgi:hypothetical protein